MSYSAVCLAVFGVPIQVDIRKRQHSGSVWFPYAMFETLRRALEDALKGAPTLQRSAEQLVAAIKRHADLAVQDSDSLERASTLEQAFMQ